MAGMVRLVRSLVVLGALVAAGLALWERREKIKQVWGTLGGSEGVLTSAAKLMDSAGPVKDLVNQVANLKK